MNKTRRIEPAFQPINLGSTSNRASNETAAVNKNSIDCILFNLKLNNSPAERLNIPTILPTNNVS